MPGQDPGEESDEEVLNAARILINMRNSSWALINEARASSRPEEEDEGTGQRSQSQMTAGNAAFEEMKVSKVVRRAEETQQTRFVPCNTVDGTALEPELPRPFTTPNRILTSAIHKRKPSIVLKLSTRPQRLHLSSPRSPNNSTPLSQLSDKNTSSTAATQVVRSSAAHASVSDTDTGTPAKLAPANPIFGSEKAKKGTKRKRESPAKAADDEDEGSVTAGGAKIRDKAPVRKRAKFDAEENKKALAKRKTKVETTINTSVNSKSKAKAKLETRAMVNGKRKRKRNTEDEDVEKEDEKNNKVEAIVPDADTARENGNKDGGEILGKARPKAKPSIKGKSNGHDGGGTTNTAPKRKRIKPE